MKVALHARVVGQELVGHVALRLRGGVVGREVHGSQHGVGDGLVRLRSGVEIQQGSDNLVVDLAAVVVGAEGRGDGRTHLAAGLVVRQLAGHIARHFALVPVGHDERQHLGLRPVLGQIQRVGSAVMAAPVFSCV